MTEAWAYYNANTIEIIGDVSAYYWPNQLVSITQTTQKFLVVMAVTVVGGNTHLAVSGGGIYALANAPITAHAVTANSGISGLPSGFLEQGLAYGAASKGTPADGDRISLWDSAANFVQKGLTWANLKATLFSYAKITKLNQGQHTLYRYYPNIISTVSTGTLAGAWIVHTPVPRAANEMFRIRVHGYFYGSARSIDFVIVGYTYDGVVGNVDGAAGAVIAYSLQDNGGDGLSKYVGIDAYGNMAVAIGSTSLSIYFGRISVDCYSTRQNADYSTGWSIDNSTTSGFGWGDIHGPLVSLGNEIYITGNCSADSFTDRTEAFAGDALAAIERIAADAEGNIDHSTLPEFARSTYMDADGEEQAGRDIGNMVSVLTTGMQQLIELLSYKEVQIADLTLRLEKLEKKVET